MHRAGFLAVLLTVVTSAWPSFGADDSLSAAALSQAITTKAPPLIVDVRSPEEYAAGHVPGARLMPIQSFPGAVTDLPADKTQPIVVYCELGPRAMLARAAMRYAGYTDVRTLDGHMRAWRESGLSIEK